MNTLKLIGLGAFASFAVSVPALAQTVVQLEEAAPNPPQTEVQQLPPSLSEPLEVGPQEAAEFFTPSQRPQSVESRTGSSGGYETLIEPPPGSQTPAQLTPGQRLSVPIQ